MVSNWRKTRGLMWSKGRTLILNITPKYRGNSIRGYSVNLYDLTRQSHLRSPTRILNISKTKAQAIKFARIYRGKN